MAKLNKHAIDRFERLLQGKVLRQYVRISKVGDRKGIETAKVGDSLLWSDKDQIAAGRQCAEDWKMVFDERESLLHSDPDVSGYSTRWDQRRGLKAHYEDAKNGEFDVLGFHFADRIGRNVRETIKAIDAFLGLGIIIYIAEQDEFITSEDREAINRLHGQMVASERYSIVLADRVRSAHKRRALSGRHHGGPAPAWLEWNPVARRYDVINQIADVMRAMVDLRLSGLTETQITRRMNQLCRTKNGKLWRQCNINRYLSIRFVEKMEGHSHFCVKGEEPILIPNQWDPILSPEKASALKSVLDSVGKKTYYEKHFVKKAEGRVSRAESASTRFLLTGKIYCASCNSRIGGFHGGGDGSRDRYACNSIVATRELHQNHQGYFRRESVEKAVMRSLTIWLKDPPPASKEPPAQITNITVIRQVEKLTQQIDELFEFFQTGAWTKEDYLRKHKELLARREELLSKVRDSGYADALQKASDLSEKATDRVSRRQLVHLLVEKIELPVYVPGKVRRSAQPRPYVRVTLRYPLSDGVRVLLSPIFITQFEAAASSCEVIAE